MATGYFNCTSAKVGVEDEGLEVLCAALMTAVPRYASWGRHCLLFAGTVLSDDYVIVRPTLRKYSHINCCFHWWTISPSHLFSPTQTGSQDKTIWWVSAITVTYLQVKSAQLCLAPYDSSLCSKTTVSGKFNSPQRTQYPTEQLCLSVHLFVWFLPCKNVDVDEQGDYLSSDRHTHIFRFPQFHFYII